MLFWVRWNYFIVFSCNSESNIAKLKNIIENHPSKSSTPSVLSTGDGITVYLKAKDKPHLRGILEGITNAVTNAKVDLIEDSGLLTTEARERWKKSVLFAFYIYVTTLFSSSLISGYLGRIDFNSPDIITELLQIIFKAAVIAIPPTIVAFTLKKANKLEM